jgi:dUTP pyrophosphatase
MNLKIKPLHPNFKPPRYATAGSAAFDLHAVTGGRIAGHMPPQRIGLGFAVEVPEGFGLILSTRSGHGLRFGASVPMGWGLIDSDYRDEVALILTVDPLSEMTWNAGDRICQAALVAMPHARFDIVTELAATDRPGGLGSTGSR